MLRNIIFSIIFFSGIIFISIIFLPALILPQKIVLTGGKLMGYWTGFCLKKILSVKIKILGTVHRREITKILKITAMISPHEFHYPAEIIGNMIS